MSFVVAYALAGAGTLLVVLWVMLYLRYSSQYDIMIAAIDKKQFFLPEIFFIGFGFMDMFKVNLKTEAGRKKEKKIAEIYGEKYAEYYHNCIVGGQITYALTVAPLGLFIGAMTNDMTFAILVVAAAAALIVYLDIEVSSAVERKHDEILSDYPEILSKLTLLVNAGMVIREAWTKVPDDSEYVMLPPDTTVVLYSDVLPLTIPSTGEKLRIKKPMVTVGRASDSDVRLSARTVARRQAAFFYEQEIWFVRDNFSTNGTWINGRKLIPGKKYQLAAYDEIGFARSEKVIFDLRNESYTPPQQETPPSPMGDFAGEKRIGEYEVIRALAPLSVKDVYLAKSSRTDRLVVLKPCRKDDRPAQKTIRELLLKEADLLRQLDHPAIPKLVEVLEDEETLCVVREYFDGETLESVMAREGTQDLIQVVDWAWQLCDVLRYLHERNYVYRDMKPGNILLRPDGRLALIDFGTMRVYKPGKAGGYRLSGYTGLCRPGAVRRYGTDRCPDRYLRSGGHALLFGDRL